MGRLCCSADAQTPVGGLVDLLLVLLPFVVHRRVLAAVLELHQRCAGLPGRCHTAWTPGLECFAHTILNAIPRPYPRFCCTCAHQPALQQQPATTDQPLVAAAGMPNTWPPLPCSLDSRRQLGNATALLPFKCPPTHHATNVVQLPNPFCTLPSSVLNVCTPSAAGSPIAALFFAHSAGVVPPPLICFQRMQSCPHLAAVFICWLNRCQGINTSFVHQKHKNARSS